MDLICLHNNTIVLILAVWWGFTAIAVQNSGCPNHQHCRGQHHDIDINLKDRKHHKCGDKSNPGTRWKQVNCTTCNPISENKYSVEDSAGYRDVYTIQHCKTDPIMRGSTAGITDGLKGTSKTHYAVLTVLDMIISSLLISPLVVSYWRGTWCLMDYYVYPERPDYSSYVSIAIGFSVIMIFTLFQFAFKDFFHPNEHCLSYYTVSRLYTAVFGFACVNSWRGAWGFLDVFTGDTPDMVWATTLASVALLAFLKSLRNISAAPFAIATDRNEGYFDVPTMFRVPGTKEAMWLYVLDCFFSVFIIGTLVVFVWRGCWCLLDIYLFPEREDLSAWGSLAMGYLLVFSTFSTQPLIKSLVSKLTGLWRLIVVDIYLIFSFCGTVNVWRGVWNLLNIYFLPDRQVTSYWVTHLACFMLLIFINSSNSILVRGVYIDGEEEGAQCVDFPCYYLRLFFQTRRRKKFLRQLQKRQIANLVGKKLETEVFPVPVVQDGSNEKTKTVPIQVVGTSHIV